MINLKLACLFFFKSNNTLPNRKITVTARSDYDDPWHLHFISEMQQLSWKKWPVKHHHSIHSRWQLFTFAHCQEHKLQRLTIKTSGHDFFLPFVFFLSLSTPMLEPLSKNGFQAKPLWSNRIVRFFLWKQNLKVQTKRGFFAHSIDTTSCILINGMRQALGNRFFCSLKRRNFLGTVKARKISQTASLIFIWYHFKHFILQKNGSL